MTDETYLWLFARQIFRNG